MRTWALQAAVKALIKADVDSMFTKRMGRVQIPDSSLLPLTLIIDRGSHKEVDAREQEGFIAVYSAPPNFPPPTFFGICGTCTIMESKRNFDELIHWEPIFLDYSFKKWQDKDTVYSNGRAPYELYLPPKSYGTIPRWLFGAPHADETGLRCLLRVS